MSPRALILLAFACLVVAAPALAARPPSVAERAAVTAALPQSFRADPVGCVFLELTIANGGRYAKATPVYLNATKPPCLKYAANGFWILKKQARWRIIYVGSELPSCKLHVPRDLSRCIP